jgi:hypothetical protein
MAGSLFEQLGQIARVLIRFFCPSQLRQVQKGFSLKPHSGRKNPVQHATFVFPNNQRHIRPQRVREQVSRTGAIHNFL